MIHLRELTKARYLAPLAALALLGGTMVACGDDDDDDDPTSAATTAASSPGATTTTAAATQPATATATSAQASGTTIRVEDNVFTPDDTTVAAGTQVNWQWAGELPHSVEGTFAGQEVKSEQKSSGTFQFTFTSAGTFDYQCGVHGQAMSGRIVVQ